MIAASPSSATGIDAPVDGRPSRPRRSTASLVLAALAFAGAAAGASIGGRAATSSGQDWLDSLERPWLMPPDAVFGIVWPVLYVMMAVAGWVAWRAGGGGDVVAAWSVQIVLNLAWSVTFFGFESIGAGLIVAIALFVAVLVATVVLWRAAPLAGLLMVPYLGWVAFAVVLNASYAAANW